MIKLMKYTNINININIIKALPAALIIASAFSVTACGRAEASIPSKEAAESESVAFETTSPETANPNESFEITINTSGKYGTSYKYNSSSKGPGVAESLPVESTAVESTAVESTAPETKAETEAESATETKAEATETLAAPTEEAAKTEEAKSKNGYSDGAEIGLNNKWKYAEMSVINSGKAKMYLARDNRKNKIIGVNAGHGTKGGSSVKTYCHPDKTAKVTGGTTKAGATKAVAVSSGMNFKDGTKESAVTLKAALILKDLLLKEGYDVLMIRETDDVQLDNVARTVICNNTADCHIALHWDGDGLDYDKGCFYMSVPDGIKYLDTVSASWKQSEALGESLIKGLSEEGCKIWNKGKLDMDLTQTSYSYIPSIDIELGNQSSDHSEERLSMQAKGLVKGINYFFGF